MTTLSTRTRKILTASLTLALMFPGAAFAGVRVDDRDLEHGENAVGGGIATYGDAMLDMVDVHAGHVSTDEDLEVSFNGGNEIDHFQVTDDATVTVNFDGENKVEDIEAYDNSDVTVNMDEHNDFEDIEANDESSVTVKVSGKVGCEAIKGYDDATVTVEGTTCPQKDVLEVGEGDTSERIGTERGDLTIKDVTVVMDSPEDRIASKEGDVTIKSSKISRGDENELVEIYAGGDMTVKDSVIDAAGSMGSEGKLTIERSDVDLTKAEKDEHPYRVWSNTDIELIEEENGEVCQGSTDDGSVSYVSTGDGDDVHLKAAKTPGYYRTCNTDDTATEPSHVLANRAPTHPLPVTGETDNILSLSLSFFAAGSVLIALGLRRRFCSVRA